MPNLISKIMSEKNKVLVEILSTVVLPKLKGLSEKNAKKIMALSEKSLGQIAKKYHHLLKDQAEKEANKREKEIKKEKKATEKLTKKNEKLAKEESILKKLDLLLNNNKNTNNKKNQTAEEKK
jgi:hypothetical protein